MKIEPLGARVLISDIPDENKTAGGIIIPDTARDRPMQGIVQAVGPGDEQTSMTVNIGDRVMFGKMAGVEAKIEGRVFRLMKLTEIMCRVIQD